METIKITVTGTQAHLIDAPTLTAGTVGQPVEFIFDEAWENLRKTAVFRAGGMTKDMVDIGNACTVPWEVMEKTGCCLHVGVYGTNASGTKVIPTAWAKLDPILPGADPSGDESTEPTLPVWEQINKAAVKTVNGIAPDEKGNVDTSYTIQVYYDGDSDTYQFVEEFDWNALEEKVTAGVPVFLHVYDSAPDLDVPVSSLLLDICDREDGIAEFRQTYYDGRLRTRKYTIYGDGTIEGEITNVPMDSTVIVTVDIETMTANHTATDIYNRIVNDHSTAILFVDDNYYALSYFTKTTAYFASRNDDFVDELFEVLEDGTVKRHVLNSVSQEGLTQILNRYVKTVNSTAPDENGNVDSRLVITVKKKDDGTYTGDHTVDEIDEAIGNGVDVTVKYNDGRQTNYYPLTFWDSTIVRFGDYCAGGFAVFRVIPENTSFKYVEPVMVRTVNGAAPDENGNVELTELGDISTALDAIIAMQEELIGI